VERFQPDGDWLVTVDKPDATLQLTVDGVVRVMANHVGVSYLAGPSRPVDTVNLLAQIDSQRPFIDVQTGPRALSIIATASDQKEPGSIKSPSDITISGVSFIEQDASNGQTISSIISGVLSFPGLAPARDVRFNDRDLVDLLDPQMLRLRELGLGVRKDISVRVDGLASGVTVGSPSIAKTYVVTRFDEFKQRSMATALAMLAWLVTTSLAVYKFVSELIDKEDKTT
jgi:hypothetical protein